MVFVYITCTDKKEAKKISRHLLEKRLIACSNIFPLESLYWWKGKIVDKNEYAILCKTVSKKFSAIQKEMKNIHSYDVPCVCMIQSEENPAFGKWIEGEVE